jgi:hypothetical protein
MDKKYVVCLIYNCGRVDTYPNCTNVTYSEAVVISFLDEHGKVIESSAVWKVIEQ